MDLKVLPYELKQKQSLPLEVKIRMTKLRIQVWYEHWDGQVYVSFSGGKDSTVLLHIVRGMYPDVKAVFFDTGLEYPEIREFVKTIDTTPINCTVGCYKNRAFAELVRYYTVILIEIGK